jgi:hypothetical protein
MRASRALARHEAAHAVVAVRTGLPLEYTTTRGGRPLNFKVEDRDQETAGETRTVSDHLLLQWFDALPDPKARAKIDSVVACTAAGIGEGIGIRKVGWEDETHRGDLLKVLRILRNLRRGGVIQETTSPEDPEGRAFITSAVDRAEEILMRDNGVAWERVTTELLRKKYLTGVQVRAIVAASDAGF